MLLHPVWLGATIYHLTWYGRVRATSCDLLQSSTHLDKIQELSSTPKFDLVLCICLTSCMLPRNPVCKTRKINLEGRNYWDYSISGQGGIGSW